MLEKKEELKLDKVHLEKQNEELLSERHQLKYMVSSWREFQQYFNIFLLIQWMHYEHYEWHSATIFDVTTSHNSTIV